MWLPITVLAIHVCIVCRFSNTGIARDIGSLKDCEFLICDCCEGDFVGISALCDTVKKHQHTPTLLSQKLLYLASYTWAETCAGRVECCHCWISLHTRWLRLNDDRQGLVASTLLAWSDRTIHYAYCYGRSQRENYLIEFENIVSALCIRAARWDGHNVIMVDDRHVPLADCKMITQWYILGLFWVKITLTQNTVPNIIVIALQQAISPCVSVHVNTNFDRQISAVCHSAASASCCHPPQ